MNCRRCGSRNREGELICQKCGVLLETPTTNRLSDVEGLASELKTKKLKQIAFEFDGWSQHISLQGVLSLLIGRGLGMSGQDGEVVVDLFEISGHEKGVSRKHAMIAIEGPAAYLVDLDSTNGTYLNGVRLPPQHQHRVRTGDVISFGALDVRVRME
jgi:hypothetical protein